LTSCCKISSREKEPIGSDCKQLSKNAACNGFGENDLLGQHLEASHDSTDDGNLK